MESSLGNNPLPNNKNEGVGAKSALRAYICDLAKIRILSSEEQEALWNLGTPDAKNKLVCSYLPYVVKVAKCSFSLNHMSDDEAIELIAAGNEGLMIAANRFDHKLGNNFITYAKYWIRERMNEQRIKQISSGVGMSRLGREFALMKETENQLADKLGIDITHGYGVPEAYLKEELRKSMDKDHVDKLLKLRSKSPKVLAKATQTFFVSDTEFELVDDKHPTIQETINRKEAAKAIQLAIENLLQPVEKFVIEAHFGFGKFKDNTLTDSEIAEALYEKGMYNFIMSHQAVNQIKQKALNKLRKDKTLQACAL